MSHLAVTLYINRLYQEQTPRIVLAGEGGFVDNVISGIKEHVLSKWNADKPLASVVAFIGPGLLFKLGFPWLSVAYEVADALGFDWVGFWDSIKNSVMSIVKSNISLSGPKPSEEDMHKQLAEATDESLKKNIHEDRINEEKLAEIAKKSKGTAMPPSTGSTTISYLIKQAGLFGSAARSRGVLSGIFRKIIPWVITRALISLGFVVAGGAARGAAGITPGTETDKSDGSTNTDQVQNAPKTRAALTDLQVSPSADPELFEFNKNDAGSVWIENGNINSIKNYMLSWINSAYPQLSKEQNAIAGSQGFIQVENMFRARNKMATGLQIYSVPKPFQRKIDIISYILETYLKTRGNNATT